MDDKFKYILELQEQGLTRHEIKDKLGYKSLDSMTKFLKKRGYAFNNILNKYTLKSEYDNNSTIVINAKELNKKEDIIIDDSSMKLDIQQDLKVNIINLAENYDLIQRMLQWFENKEYDNSSTSVIEVIEEGIKINLEQSEIIRTTIRINQKTWDKFDAFCKTNKEFNKQDLMAQALEDYIEKHK